MKHSRRKVIVMVMSGFLTTSVFAHASGGVAIKDAWVREAPPNAKVLAAYMTIENHTGAEKVLTTVKSSSFEKIEMHKTVQKDGMASMVQQKHIKIPAEGEVKLQPGGMHLMLFNPSSKLKAGDNVSFTLKFANGSTSMIDATVKKAMGGDHHHDHHGDHSDHGDHSKHEMNQEHKEHQSQEHHHNH